MGTPCLRPRRPRQALASAPVFLLVLALLSAMAPPGEAAWSAKGAREPDTARDAADGWMRLEPDHALGGSRVYLNGFLGQEAGYGASVGTSVNPNAAAAGSSHQAYPARVRALLGVWKDCNRDGYVGLGDQGLWEYRAELLGDASVCRATGPRTPWHNDGKWVREFVPIGWQSSAVGPDGRPVDHNPYDVPDTGARVWADEGAPGEPPGKACHTLAHPRGTFRDVGGMVDVADCALDGRLARVVADAFSSSGLGPSWWAAARATPNPWGAPGDAEMVAVWDCEAAPLMAGPAWVSAPRAAPVASAGGSPAGTMNATLSGLDGCGRPATRAEGEASAAHRVASLPYATETDAVANQRARRVQADFPLFYAEGRRPSSLVAPLPLGPGAPGDGGLGSPLHSEGLWSAVGVRAASSNPFLSRDALGARAVTHLTFHAFVSPTAVAAYGLQLPAGGLTGSYGAEACPAGTAPGAPDANGWACDPAAWWPGDTMPRSLLLGRDPDAPSKGVPVGAVPGSPFNLRDVDCHDESAAGARDAGVQWGVLTGTACG